ncbi:hypothetical protein COV23_00615 [Candidatus Wolfebacteria bacterium CG10_big_fil_rev_8_21_14_0_10_31_9]|uniref:Clp R domain-containing protein n=1 Tax=Candidatus Wolfebacteria bacterium CG10_big_fil_rev_8_21_14_0_10_31_9 TaxID=1975070 RepID=A0A2H0RD38_9BACT|nr:MAG: hypothetical protein COV23_00615 [Candidatus Wolfebacteria bacterium CG10_big_fil_rev_8_21_14_0_10_31_9]
MEKKIDLEKIIFCDPRFDFSIFQRFLWNCISYAFYVFLVVGTVVFIFSDVERLRWVGLLFLLFLIDRAFLINKAKHSIVELNSTPTDGINTSDFLSAKSFRILERSMDMTESVGGDFYLNILKNLIKRKEIRGALWRMEVSPEEFEQKVDEEIEKIKDKKIIKKEVIIKVEELVKIAFLKAYTSQNIFIEPGDIFSAIGETSSEAIKKIFYLFSINANDLNKALIFSRYRHKYSLVKRLPQTIGGFARKPFGIRHRIMNRAWTAKPTPILDMFSDDLTDLARESEIGFLIGHKKEHSQLLNILSRPTRPNVLLVGEPGSGKETIVSRIAFEIIKDKVSEPLFDKRVVSLQIGSLISGADPKEVSERVNKILGEIISSKNIILYIPDIHNLVKTSGEGFMSAADIMLSVFKSDAIQVIGATYPKELKLSLESRSDFLNIFEIVRVEEISEDEAITLLIYESIILEEQYKIIVSFEAVKEAVSLAHKYFRQKLLPSSAEDLLKESIAEASQRGDKVLKADHVISISERKVNVPIHKASKEEAKSLLNLEDTIHQSLIDQEEAVKSVSSAIREYRSGLSRQGGPIASFLFVGPTGVGKTELAKILAKTQFGSESAMVRFDMSEYQDKQSIFRFIGSPDGKISGGLTESIIQKPYSLILLDEFEKAHPDTLNIFLQVFDDGRLTDNLGRVVDFTNTMIIATSNAESNYIKEQIENGKKISEIKDEFKKKLASYFRPELLNRFSDVIIFKNLSRGDILSITKLQLNKLAKLAAENQGISLDFDDAVVDKISKIGYDPVFGARPLRGAISENIKNVLAERILRDEVKKGDVVRVVLEGGEIIFK